MSSWHAERIVDERLARRLLARFTDLPLESLRPFAEGWDYAIWLVDETWAFRFPRRAIAVPGVEREIAVLPELAPLLPLPVPTPVFVGRSTDDFPWPFFGSRLLPGRELCDLPLDDDARGRIAGSIASFLRALHALELPLDLPADANRRADMPTRVPKTREQLARVKALGIWAAPDSVLRFLDEAERLSPFEALAIVHGDLHFRQLLAEDDGELTGVIDWVDVCRSDPAIDLSMFWSFVPPTRRPEFLEAYGPVSDEQLSRARVVALFLSAVLAEYAHAEGMEAVLREAVGGLDRAAQE